MDSVQIKCYMAVFSVHFLQASFQEHVVQLVESEHIEPDESDEEEEEGEARPDLPSSGADVPPK